MAKSLKMLCIGAATQDVFLLGGDVFKPYHEKTGYFEHLPLGAKLIVEDAVFSAGGDALNAATTFARQGLNSQFIGLVGEESAGQSVMQTLDAENIDASYVRQSNIYRTSYSTLLLAPNGERTVLTYYGTKMLADGSQIDWRAIEQADWLYLSSVGSMELLEKIVTAAVKHGVKIAINPSGRELAQIDKLRPILDDVDILVANKEEFALLVEGKTADELIRHATHIAPIVVLSDGPNGVLATDGTQLVKAGMYEDVKVVDRTGAGDAFGSGFVAMHAQGKDLAAAVTFASANATSVVTKIGATAGILHRSAKLHDMPLKITDL